MWCIQNQLGLFMWWSLHVIRGLDVFQKTNSLKMNDHEMGWRITVLSWCRFMCLSVCLWMPVLWSQSATLYLYIVYFKYAIITLLTYPLPNSSWACQVSKLTHTTHFLLHPRHPLLPFPLSRHMTTISLNELKSKIRASYKRKLKGTKGTKSTKEIALVFTQKYKGICKNCGKQGHKANLCQSKMNTSGTNANWTNAEELLRMCVCPYNGRRVVQRPILHVKQRNGALACGHRGYHAHHYDWRIHDQRRKCQRLGHCWWW